METELQSRLWDGVAGQNLVGSQNSLLNRAAGSSLSWSWRAGFSGFGVVFWTFGLNNLLDRVTGQSLSLSLSWRAEFGGVTGRLWGRVTS